MPNLFFEATPAFHVTLVVESIHLLSPADDEKSPVDEADGHEHEEREDPDAQLAGPRASNEIW